MNETKVIEGLLEDEDIQHVIQGFLVVEVLSPDQDEPTLVTRDIGDPAAWTALGMLEAAAQSQRQALTAGFEEDDD